MLPPLRLVVKAGKEALKTLSRKALIKQAGLPNKGRIRFVPKQTDVRYLSKDGGAYIDKFGNRWVRPKGQLDGERHWDVQLSKTGMNNFDWLLKRNKTHLNVTRDGRIPH